MRKSRVILIGMAIIAGIFFATVYFAEPLHLNFIATPLYTMLSASQRLAAGLGPGFIGAFVLILFSATLTWENYQRDSAGLTADEQWLKKIIGLILYESKFTDYLFKGLDQEMCENESKSNGQNEFFANFSKWLDEMIRQHELRPYSLFSASNEKSHFNKKKKNLQTGKAVRYYLFLIFLSPKGRDGSKSTDYPLTRLRYELLLKPSSRILFLGGILPGIGISIGLFGTITGMYKVFKNTAAQNMADPGQLGNVINSLMGSLSEAMFTTAIALIISIALILITAPLKVRMRKIFIQLEEVKEALASKF